MLNRSALWIVCIVACSFLHDVNAQFGGGGKVDNEQPNLAGFGQVPGQDQKVILPDSEVARFLREQLDTPVTLGEIRCELSSLSEALSTDSMQIPLFLDDRGLKLAGVESDLRVEGVFKPQPLRSVLFQMLHPHGLHVIIQNEGLLITADFTELARRGRAIHRWVGLDEQFAGKVKAAMKKKASFAYQDMPLSEVAQLWSEQWELPVMIHTRAMEDIGLSPNAEVTIHLQDITFGSAMKLMLDQLDMTYSMDNGLFLFTTREQAEQQPMTRIYWLEGTGLPVGEFDNLIEVIQGSIEPDSWEHLGGPGVIQPLTHGVQNRPAVLVSATCEIHQQIDALLMAMREGHVGPDPILGPK
ncbi:MAG: hypothetical protein VXZ38_01915 [Planctomycetota bacterium]|nr:hypothetical protein [Planctomycetota bacterium]